MCHTVQVGGTSEEVGGETNINTIQNTTTSPLLSTQQVHANMKMIPVPRTPQPMSPLAVVSQQQPPVFSESISRSIDDIYSFDEVNEEETDEANTNPSNPGVITNRRNQLPVEIGGNTSNGGDSNPLLVNGTVNVATDSVSDRLEGINGTLQQELRATINNFKSELVNRLFMIKFILIKYL